MQGAQDDEQQSARPDARGEARAAGRAPRGVRREKAHVAACVQIPRITQLSIIRRTLIVNKRQTIRFVLLQCYALHAAH